MSSPPRTSGWNPLTTRRGFLQRAAGMAGAAAAIGTTAAWSRPSARTGRSTRMKPRPDLLDERSPRTIEVFQLSNEAGVPYSHLYMEAQVFTPDSKRFILHRSATPHGGNVTDPEHHYLLCDLEDGGRLTTIIDELGCTAASVSPDGQWVYYFLDRTRVNEGSLRLKRVRLDGSGRETITVIDTALPGTRYRPSLLYCLSTISSDGRRVAISAFLGDGQTPNAPFGLLVFDVQKGSADLVLEGPTWCNMHAQYSRSADHDQRRDILVQENHGNVTDARGETTVLVSGAGADIHVIRDDGTHLRDMPWGRDGNEQCQGHQYWRGRSAWAITSTDSRSPAEAQLIEGRAAPHVGHVGSETPGGVRNDLSRNFTNPHFYHFGTDIRGTRLVSDAGSFDRDAQIVLMKLGEPGIEPARELTYLLSPRSSCEKGAHIHPFLSPDGRMAFFNSDESGLLQAYMIRGL